MELEPGEQVKFMGKKFTYLGLIEPFACLVTDDPEPLAVYCSPESVIKTPLDIPGLVD